MVFKLEYGGTGVPVSIASFNGLSSDGTGQFSFVGTECSTISYKAMRSDRRILAAVITCEVAAINLSFIRASIQGICVDTTIIRRAGAQALK